MKALHIMFLCLCPPLVGWAVADKVDNRNFGVDTYYPNRNEIHAAQQRVEQYCQNNSQGSPTPTRFLAGSTTSLVHTNQDQYSKVLHSQTILSSFGHVDSVALSAAGV